MSDKKDQFTQIPSDQINVLYCVRDAGGGIVKQGQCSLDVVDLQAAEPGQTVEIVPELVEEELPPTRWDKRRLSQYPKITDQLGAIWKALELLKQQGMDIGPEAEQVLAQINDTKARHPKQ